VQDGKVSCKEAGQRHRQFAVHRRCARDLSPVPTARANVAAHRSAGAKVHVAANGECASRRKRAIDGRPAGRADCPVARQCSRLPRVNACCGNSLAGLRGLRANLSRASVVDVHLQRMSTRHPAIGLGVVAWAPIQRVEPITCAVGPIRGKLPVTLRVSATARQGGKR